MIYKYNPIEDCNATKKKIYIFRNQIEKFIKKNKNLATLDFGCENANDCGKFLISPKYKYIGYDIHIPSLKFAEKNFGNKNVSFCSKVDNKKYDIIIISEVLEHLKHPMETLKLLKKDGIILGSVLNGYRLTEIEKFIIHKFGVYSFARYIYGFFKEKKKIVNSVPFNRESGHIQFFTLGNLKRVIKNIGLELEYLKNGYIMGGDITGSTTFRSEILKRLNTKIADFIPSFLSATWIFKLRKEVK